ncbi:MAG: hypothetical protein H7070_00040 [Saprospiraceae bacterium]|nr:hypothetical protein [Pyrinomonadaceae bacterium]
MRIKVKGQTAGYLPASIALIFLSTVLLTGIATSQSPDVEFDPAPPDLYIETQILTSDTEALRSQHIDKSSFAENGRDFDDWRFKLARIQYERRFGVPTSHKVINDSANTQTQVSTQKPIKEKFHWRNALIQSVIMLGVQHGIRLTQDKTQKELGGPFFRDWKDSVKTLRGWGDGDNFFINYIAHSLQGAATGRIFIYNSDKAKKQEFGKSKDYWEGRVKALAWSAVWSTQFEIGPISEASIGNVGKRGNRVPSSGLSWGDLIVTPVVGTGVLVAEDALDKYIMKNWLEGRSTRFMTRILRMFLAPTITVTNVLRGRHPWHRDTRP